MKKWRHCYLFPKNIEFFLETRLHACNTRWMLFCEYLNWVFLRYRTLTKYLSTCRGIFLLNFFAMDVGQKWLVSVCWLLVQDCCTVKVTYFRPFYRRSAQPISTVPSSTNSPIIDLTTPIIVVTDLSLLLFFLLDGKWDWGKSIKSVFVIYGMKGDFVTASQLLLYVNWKTTTAVVRGYKKHRSRKWRMEDRCDF